MICKNCGKEISDTAKFCPYCGKSTSESKGQILIQSIEKPTSKKAAFKFYAIVISVCVIICVIICIIINAVDNKNYNETQKKFDSLQNSYFEFLPDITIGELLNDTHSWSEPNNEGKDDEMWLTLYDCPTFLGVNDETGLTLEITFTGYYNESGSPQILKARINTSDNKVLQNMSNEEFKTYILDLYSSYNGNNKLPDTTAAETDVKTIATTAAKSALTKAKTTASEPVKTTTAPKKSEPQKSSDYLVYLAFINVLDLDMKVEYGEDTFLYHDYYLYDIDNNGTYELLVHIGESEADAVISVYSVDENGEPLELGEISGSHMQLVEKDGKLYSNMCRMGYQTINEIKMIYRYGVWSVTEENVFEESNLTDYKNYGIAVKSYDISDTSAIEALCPKDALADKPYVHAYVKTYDYSGRDGSESRLYLDGDFSAVSVLIQSMGDTREIEFYSKEDYDDYIDMRFNAAGSPPSVVYVTPYSDSGVAGDVVVCDIPTDISGTIQTGGYAGVLNSEMKGQINCHGGTVAGFTTDYVVNGGAVGKVRNSLGDKWHVTAKNVCYNYDVTWYELWDSDDGDYYGWVDSDYIDFY